MLVEVIAFFAHVACRLDEQGAFAGNHEQLSHEECQGLCLTMVG
jgi:hypothetical protein